MALVLSNQENIDLLLFWLKLAVSICCIAIAALALFWLKLKNLEKRVSSQKFTSQFAQKKLSRHPHRLLRLPHQLPPQKASRHHRFDHKRPFTYSRSLWRWLLAIASIAGVTVALSNGFISSEVTTFLWLLVGVMLVAVATFEI